MTITREHRAESNLIDALKSGDETAFRALVGELNPGLARLARAYVPRSVADDAVQDTWASVIQGIDRFEQRSSLKTWIYRILLNKVRNLAAREFRMIPFAALGSGEGESAVRSTRMHNRSRGAGYWAQPPYRWELQPSDVLESEEMMEVLTVAMQSLPAGQHEVVLLRDVQGLSAHEVSDILGVSMVNQRVLLHRGRSRIRASIEEYMA